MPHVETVLIAAILLTGLLIVTLATSGRNEAPEPVARAPITSQRDLTQDLERCKALRAEDGVDPRCRAVWEENRRRFFGGRPAADGGTP